MSRHRLGARLATLAAVTLLVAIGTPMTSALEAEGFTITDSKLKQSKDFDPIPGMNPTAQVEDPTLDECKTLPSDVAVKLTFAIKSEVPTKAKFTTTWPAFEANDVDVYFFTDEGDAISDAATGDHPEVFTLGGLPNGVYWLCVRNFSGVNAGFTVAVEANFLDLFERPPAPPTPKPSEAPPAKTATPSTNVDRITDDEPEVTPEAIETPGPDGATAEQKLLAVSGNRQASPSEGGRSGLSIGLLALSGVIVATGAGLVIVRIRRDTKLG